MSSTWSPKDPDDVVDRGLNWYDALEGDVIANSVYTVVTGTVTLSGGGFTDSVTKIRVTGGVNGETATIRNRITTVSGQQMDETVSILVASQ